MHDPMVVAFAIVRPWPQRTSFSATGSRGDGVRWRMRLNHQHTSYCLEHDPAHRDGPFPWWRPGSYSRFWRVAGRDVYWPALVTIWHVEPHNRDSGDVCPHYRRWQDEDGKWQSRSLHAWKWHVWHWRIQVHALQALRRSLLTRCAWCGGRSRSGDPVNISHSWDGPKSRWWHGERGLFHHDCSSVEHAQRMCLCAIPVLARGDYGKCEGCAKFRGYGSVPDEADRLLTSLPAGSRIPAAMKPELEARWAERRARKEAAE